MPLRAPRGSGEPPPYRRQSSASAADDDGLVSAVLSRSRLQTLKLLQDGADPNCCVPVPMGEEEEPQLRSARPDGGPESGPARRPLPLLGEERVLQQAVRDGSEPLVRILLEHGADVNAANAAGSTALHTAAAGASSDGVLRALLAAPGVQLEARDRLGCTPLHLAAADGAAGRVRLLLEAGASVAARNGAGFTPLVDIVRRCPECLEAAFDRCLELREPGGPTDRRVVFDYSVFDPRLLDPPPDEAPLSARAAPQVETLLLNSVQDRRAQKQLFLHPLCQTFLNLKWGIVWPFYVLHTAMFALFVACFNVFVVVVIKRPDFDLAPTDASSPTSTRTVSPTSSAPMADSNLTATSSSPYASVGSTESSERWEVAMLSLTVLAVIMLLIRELQRLFVIGPRAYLRATENVVVWLCCAGAVACLAAADHSPAVFRQLSAATLLVSWAELLYLFGLSELASIHVMTLVTLVRTMALFMMVYALVMLAFASCFLVLFQSQEEFGSPAETYIATLVMSIGELNYAPERLRGSGFGYVAYLLFIFFVLIITMNAMIGLAVNDTRHIEQRANVRLHTKHLEYVHLFEQHLQGGCRRLWLLLPRAELRLLTRLPPHGLEVRLGGRRQARSLLHRLLGALRRVPVREAELLRLARWLKNRPRLLAAAAGVVLARRRLEAERQPPRRTESLPEEPNPEEEEEGREWEELRRNTLELKCDVGELRAEVARIGRSVQLVLDMLDQARASEDK
ncbi:transient receptor potential channel pyrexia-like [Amphibalanus amphitrite]|uniref:transient receptor potential channel pyrexia-like n=1 Tax=Amphibalanus amphitrite TaxID=1232801 RepID=UPI001C91BB2E|nr:transient receptor potential channel pyrexia-like [Amphibalanus amphitrite]